MLGPLPSPLSLNHLATVFIHVAVFLSRFCVGASLLLSLLQLPSPVRRPPAPVFRPPTFSSRLFLPIVFFFFLCPGFVLIALPPAFGEVRRELPPTSSRSALRGVRVSLRVRCPPSRPPYFSYSYFSPAFDVGLLSCCLCPLRCSADHTAILILITS